MLFGPATASHVQPTASGYRSRYPLVGTGPVNQANPSYFAPPFHYMQTSVPGYRPRYPLHHTEPVNRANSPYFAPPFHYESASATPDAAYPHHSATQSHYASPLQYHPAPTTHGSYASPLQYPYAQYSPAQYPSAQYPPAQYPPAQTTSTDYAALSTLTKECLRRSTANSEGFTDATTEDINDDAIFGPVLIKPHARSCDGFEGHETTLGLPHRVYREWSNSPYDNAWMEMAGIAENILQDFTSKEKLEHLILKGALHIGDELYVNMPYTDGKETMDVEKSARVSGYSLGISLADSRTDPPPIDHGTQQTCRYVVLCQRGASRRTEDMQGTHEYPPDLQSTRPENTTPCHFSGVEAA